ncbi:formin-like protein 1 [Iris pallida]|uniref:Formin-like protein 1 n=1 Tax=Iris pallida TaxID=29817 RepID=A0AAX6G7R9_IRIPA|nr:formin-like protein 1 [Iris pallida]
MSISVRSPKKKPPKTGYHLLEKKLSIDFPPLSLISLPLLLLSTTHVTLSPLLLLSVVSLFLQTLTIILTSSPPSVTGAASTTTPRFLLQTIEEEQEEAKRRYPVLCSFFSFLILTLLSIDLMEICLNPLEAVISLFIHNFFHEFMVLFHFSLIDSLFLGQFQLG